MEGYKDILGLWVDEAEGAKFWLGICNDLKNRGVKEILIACMDGLKGLPQAIQTVFPSANIQTCIVHQIRNSIKYIASKDKKSFMKDLKEVYKAPTEELALAQLDKLKETWGNSYGMVIDSWYNNWNNLSTFFDFSPRIRKMRKSIICCAASNGWPPASLPRKRAAPSRCAPTWTCSAA